MIFPLPRSQEGLLERLQRERRSGDRRVSQSIADFVAHGVAEGVPAQGGPGERRQRIERRVGARDLFDATELATEEPGGSDGSGGSGGSGEEETRMICAGALSSAGSRRNEEEPPGVRDATVISRMDLLHPPDPGPGPALCDLPPGDSPDGDELTGIVPRA